MNNSPSQLDTRVKQLENKQQAQDIQPSICCKPEELGALISGHQRAHVWVIDGVPDPLDLEKLHRENPDTVILIDDIPRKDSGKSG